MNEANMTARKARRASGGNRISRKQARKAKRWDHNKVSSKPKAKPKEAST